MRRSTTRSIARRLAAACGGLAIVAAAGCGGGGGEPRFDVVTIPMKTPADPDARVAPTPLIASRSRPILLSISIPPNHAGSTLETRLLDEKGELVWIGVGLRRAEGLDTGQLLIPPGFLRPGDYRLVVGVPRADASRVEFPFRVE